MAEPPPTVANTPLTSSPPVPEPQILHRTTTHAAAFEEAVWGPVFNRRRGPARASPPRAVVRATHASHARVAVELARELGVRVSVRSGGHSWAAWSVRADAVLLDLAGLRKAVGAIRYDEDTAVVGCPPSCTGRELNRFLGKKGRIFAGGHCPDVGLGGFLLQGGMGWNCKNWGWACESVVAIDVVTADGRELRCSEDEHADLFWASRGAGPGFPAIVTRFYLKTRPTYEMYQSLYIYPITKCKEVIQWVMDASDGADGDTEMVVVSSRMLVPGSNEPAVLANLTTFKTSRDEGKAALQPLHDDARRPPGALTEVFCQPTSLDQEYDAQTVASPPDHRYCCDDSYIAPGQSVPDVLEHAFTTIPEDTKTFAFYYAMNPTSRRQPDMALSMQTDVYFAVYCTWEREADDARCISWVRDVMRGVERHEAGSYLGDADFQARRTKFWSDENGKKLMEVRRKWDPEGRICGFLDDGDKSGIQGLRNEFEWAEEQRT